MKPILIFFITLLFYLIYGYENSPLEVDARAHEVETKSEV